jgi:hypothetical protein
MARSARDPGLNFLPEPLRESWLDAAEVSISIDDGTVRGVSFFLDTALELGEILDMAGGREVVLPHELRLRERFDLAPRHWVKLHNPTSQLTRYSQYFQLDPRLEYPVTSLRVFSRMYGVAPLASIEPALRPALLDGDAAWFLVVKHFLHGPEARIACRMRRVVAIEALHTLVATGHASATLADRYAGVLATESCGAHCFITLDPARRHAISVDLEGVPADDSTRAVPALARAERLRYVKYRGTREPSGPFARTAYLLVSELAWGRQSGRSPVPAPR